MPQDNLEPIDQMLSDLRVGEARILVEPQHLHVCFWLWICHSHDWKICRSIPPWYTNNRPASRIINMVYFALGATDLYICWLPAISGYVSDFHPPRFPFSISLLRSVFRFTFTDTRTKGKKQKILIFITEGSEPLQRPPPAWSPTKLPVPPFMPFFQIILVLRRFPKKYVAVAIAHVPSMQETPPNTCSPE